jgi:hypothetical protein
MEYEILEIIITTFAKADRDVAKSIIESLAQSVDDGQCSHENGMHIFTCV